MKDLVFAPSFLLSIVLPADSVAQLIEDGEFEPREALYLPKRITMRPGYRDFAVGEVVRGFSAVGDWHLPLRITEVAHKTFGQITDEEAREDGYETASDVTDPERGLPIFYQPGFYNFSPAGEVTIIRFELNF